MKVITRILIPFAFLLVAVLNSTSDVEAKKHPCKDSPKCPTATVTLTPTLKPKRNTPVSKRDPHCPPYRLVCPSWPGITPTVKP